MAAANTLAPYAAATVGKTFGQSGSHPNEAAQLLSHAVIGGLLAYANGGSFGTGAVAGAGAEAAAKAITAGLYGQEAADNPNNLTEDQKENIRSLSSAVGAFVGSIGGDSALSAQINTAVGKNAVENNYLSITDAYNLMAELNRAATDKEKERILKKYQELGERQSKALRDSCRGKGDECHLNTIADLRNTNQMAATILNNGMFLMFNDKGRNQLSAWGLVQQSNLPDLSYHENSLSAGAKVLDTGIKLSPMVGAAVSVGASKAASMASKTMKPNTAVNNQTGRYSNTDGEMVGTNKPVKPRTGNYILPVGRQTIDPTRTSFSQATVSYQKRGASYNYDSIVTEMKKQNKWVEEPVDVVNMPDRVPTSMDNTRILAAREAGVKVEANVHNFNDLLSPKERIRFKQDGVEPQTWGEAIQLRIRKQATQKGVPMGWSQRFPNGSIYDVKVIKK